MNKHPFDYSGSSIWTTDSKLKMITVAKMNGENRREQIKKTEQSLNERKQCLTYSKASSSK